MYDELVKMLRACSERDSCIGWKEACPYLGTGVCNNKAEKAADAIEELNREVEECKAAYRKEHNKRIAENRYLYDELTKAVRAKLLMTPMRVEVPQPPKEE